jgi:hypothetical protein
MNVYRAQFEYEFKYNIWKLTVNFLFYKAVNKHPHELRIYDGYKHFYDKGVHPYQMSEILINNMEDYIEGTDES